MKEQLAAFVKEMDTLMEAPEGTDMGEQFHRVANAYTTFRVEYAKEVQQEALAASQLDSVPLNCQHEDFPVRPEV